MTELNDEQIKNMETKGFNRWTKGKYDRMYFNIDRGGGLEIEYYKSGNISYAELDGEKISNSQAYRILAVTAYVDVATGEPHVYGGYQDEQEIVKDIMMKALKDSTVKNHFDAKEKIVESGGSTVFDNWNETFGITKEEFLENLAWVCQDDGLTKEIAIEANHDALQKAYNLALPEDQKKMYSLPYDEDKCEAHIVKLHRQKDANGSVEFFRVSDNTPYMPTEMISINGRDRI